MCLCVSNKVNVENKNPVITRDQPLVHSYTYSETKHDTNMFIFCCQKQQNKQSERKVWQQDIVPSNV